MSQNNESKKTSGILWFFIGILIIGFIVYAFYWLDQKNNRLNEENKNLQSENTNLQKDVATKEEKSISPTPTPSVTSSESSGVCSLNSDPNVSGWKTYNDDFYGISFKYPQTWVIKTQEDNRTSFQDAGSEIYFYWLSDIMTAFGLESYELESESKVKIGCDEYTKRVFKGMVPEESSRMVITQFQKDGVEHMFMMSYKYQGASVSSDIMEAYDSILKSYLVN